MYCYLEIKVHFDFNLTKHLGPVVQSIVSLTSSLSGQLVKCLQLYKQIHWYFWWRSERSFSIFFQQKYWRIWDIKIWIFNETLTNDVVIFEQPGPDINLLDAEL